MNAGANAATLVAAMQERYIRRFRDAGAVSADRAMSLEDIGCRPSAVFRRLVDRRFFVEAQPDRYYLNVERVDSFRASQRRNLLIAAALLVVIVLIAALTR